MTPSQTPLNACVKVWLERGGRHAFAQGLCAILEAVDRAGAIKQAAATLGKSYRHLWARIKDAEETLDGPLVPTRVGGAGPRRSSLTRQSCDLIAAFAGLRSALVEVVAAEYARRFPPASGATPP